MATDARHGLRITRPARWVVGRVERSGGLVTRVTWHLVDGSTVRWASRAARRRGQVEVRDPAGITTRVVRAERGTAARLARTNLAAGLAFVVGGALFAFGPVLAEAGVGSVHGVDTVYLVGGLFFSTGGYASVLQASNAPTDIDERGTLSRAAWTWWAWRPHQIGWLSVAILFAGTLFFGVSLVAAYASDLTARQSDGWIWLPDMVGCVCFLVSGHLALLEVCHGRIGVLPRDLGWWVVAVNQLGSVLFFLAGVAAFVRPATSTEINLGLVDWGTFAGAVCFVAGGALQLGERPGA
ncbi:hypothetical protein ACFT5B_18530 [Luteimicrobium sp. NPDC057192]|uniref:hypothetical protein n=1 Tax=Luteimicrobium sp. NPDC057192 TaxID=3346042 RepID=UPI003642D483